MLRKMGWKADIYIPHGYPSDLLFGTPDVVGPMSKSPKILDQIILGVKTEILYLRILSKYRYHFFHGNLEHFTLFENSRFFSKLFGKSFRINLQLAKLLRRKIIFLPSGAPDEEMPNVIAALGNDEEGVAVRDSRAMAVHFKVINKYSDLNIGFGVLDSSQYKATHIKYKSIDLSLWRPDLEVPKDYQLPQSSKIRILHSFMYQKARMESQGGNIKGSLYVQQAIAQLISEGYEIEALSFDGVKSSDYRFYQIQADIIVEELIRGSWGSTAVECMALGKPVVTYIRSDWEKRYYELFPDTNPLPLVNANKWTIYYVLKHLLDDLSSLHRIGSQSREFAIKHLDPEVNVKEFAKLIQRL
jgi:glycosyltransferase involved in cell wall biosynthesis